MLLLAVQGTLQVNQDLLDKKCSSDAQCSAPWIVCDSGKCKHKGIFPMEVLEFVGVLVFLLVNALSSAAGIGGGALLVPIGLILFNMSTKQAVGLSNGLTLFSSIVSYLMALKRHDP